MEDNNDVKYDLTGKKIIPLNAPIGFANLTPPTTLPFQAVEKGQSVSEGLCAGQGIPYYEDPTPAILEEIESLLSDTANQDNQSSVKINKLANILKSMLTSPVVNPNAVPTTLKMMLDMYHTISQPIALLSMGAIPEWSQSVRDNNGGYPKDFVIREYDTTGYWVYYQSQIDNNMHDKPTLASYDGWSIISCYQFNEQFQSPAYKILAKDGGRAILTSKLFYYINTKGEERTCYNEDLCRTPSVMTNDISSTSWQSIGQPKAGCYQTANQKTFFAEGGGTPDIVVSYVGNSLIGGLQNIALDITPTALQPVLKSGTYYIRLKEDLGLRPFNILTTIATGGSLDSQVGSASGEFYLMQFDGNTLSIYLLNWKGKWSINLFGQLAGYTGDLLTKIRNYKLHPNYKQLSELQITELDKYYLELEEIKDSTKVTAPAWLEAELENKELA